MSCARPNCDVCTVSTAYTKHCLYCDNLTLPDRDVCKKCADFLDQPTDIIPRASLDIKCECGSDSLSSPNHSHYCPKFSPA